MRILVTGITGFVGRYLAEYLQTISNVKISGTSFGSNKNYFSKKVKIFRCDLRKKESCDLVLKKTKPDVIVHLAGISSAGDSWREAENTLTNNIIGQLHLLNSLKEHAPKSKLLIISSAQVYGSVGKSNLPTKEDTVLNPTNPYAVSKITQEYLGRQFFANYKIPVVILRPSNHIGPRQEGNLVVPRFVQQIVEIEKGSKKPVITVGNLNTKRDFTDVRDIVKAYYLAIRYCRPGEIYNVGRGHAVRIREILNKLISMSNILVKIKSEKIFLRPSDIPILEVDYSKFKKATGWSPKIPLSQTLEDTLEYWREKV